MNLDVTEECSSWQLSCTIARHREVHREHWCRAANLLWYKASITMQKCQNYSEYLACMWDMCACETFETSWAFLRESWTCQKNAMQSPYNCNTCTISIVCCRHFLAAILGYDTHAHSAALRYLVSLHIVTSSSWYWLRQWLDFPYAAGQNITFGIAGYKNTKIKLLSKWLFRHLVIPQLPSTWRTFTYLHKNTWFIITKYHNWTDYW